jgi:UDP-N-acetylglucosamine 1-carboxyvinyltransferase
MSWSSRASILVLGPMVCALWLVMLSGLAGGFCAIGSRPVDLPHPWTRAMGAEITVEDGYIKGPRPDGGLRGAHFSSILPCQLPVREHSLAATLAKGRTVLENAA